MARPSEPFGCRLREAIRLVSLTACLLASNAVAAEPNVKAVIVFSGMWWSEQQVAGLDPNHPPAMTTRATLDQWNAEDQWPPHPDVVDVDVTLTGTQSASNVPVQIGYRWFAKGHLTPLRVLKNDLVTFASGSDQTLHASVKVGDYLNQGHLPKRLRVEIKIASQEPIVRELPFVVGD